MRIAKADLPFRKTYKQIFTDKVLETVAIPTVIPLTDSLIDAEKKEISGKFYEKELSLVGDKADYNENGTVEITVHLISIALMEFFPDNTLAKFKEEIALDGDWRFALSEIIFPTKLNNVTDNEFTYFRASEVVASKSNAGNRNTISRPYYCENVFNN